MRHELEKVGNQIQDLRNIVAINAIIRVPAEKKYLVYCNNTCRNRVRKEKAVDIIQEMISQLGIGKKHKTSLVAEAR